MSEEKEEKNERQLGFDEGIDSHSNWMFAAVWHLAHEGKIAPNIADLIFNKIESMTMDDFNEWENTQLDIEEEAF